MHKARLAPRYEDRIWLCSFLSPRSPTGCDHSVVVYFNAHRQRESKQTAADQSDRHNAMVHTDDDEDELEWSIHDLDHAPPPPPPGDLSPLQGVGNRRRVLSTPIVAMGGSSRRLDLVPPPHSPPARPRLWSAGSSSQVTTTTQPSSLPPPRMSSARSFPPDGFGMAVASSTVEEKQEIGESGHSGRLFLRDESLQRSDHSDLRGGRTWDTSPNEHSVNSQWTESDVPSEEDVEEEEEGGKDEDADMSSSERRQPVICLGFKLPRWCTQSPISMHRVAVFLATWAPCFLFFRMRHTTDRAVLGRLNILCTFFAAGQITSSVWFLVVLLSPRVADRDLTTETEEEELAADNKEVLQLTWNPNGDVLWLGLCGFIMFVSSILASRMIRNVNLIGAIRYLWTILWVFPFMVFFVIGLFDYFRVSEVWIKFWWRDKTMAAFRESFCDPSETANTLCAVPVYANPQNETQWCIDNYQATNCTAIRDAAQKGMERFLLGYYYLNAVWGICFLVLLLLVVNTLESIISRPLVQKSRESNIPAYLALPIVGCTAFGVLFAFSGSSAQNTSLDSTTEVNWIGPLYICAGGTRFTSGGIWGLFMAFRELTSSLTPTCVTGLFFLAAMLAWHINAVSIRSTRDKRWKSVAILAFIFLMVSLLVMLITIFTASILFSVDIADVFLGPNRGDFACFLDRSGSCSRCDELVGRCPEWSTEDVKKVLQSQAKSSATLAAMFLIYAGSAIRFGFNLRRHNSMYQIDYV